MNKFWHLDECIDRKSVLDTLKTFKKDGKIEYSVDGEILKIQDIDLTEEEIEEILDLFDDNDVFENLEYGEDDEEDWGSDEWSDEDEY